MDSPRDASVQSRSVTVLLGVIAAVTLGILILDAETPLGVATGLAYVVPVMLAAQLPWRAAPVFTAGVAAVLVGVGYYISPPAVASAEANLLVVLANRLLSVLVIFVTAVLALWWQRYAMQLRQERAQLRTVVDTSADAVITVDDAAVIRSFSRAGEALFGYSERELIGRNVDALSPSSLEKGRGATIARFLAAGERRLGAAGRQVTACRKDGVAFPAHMTVGEIETRRGTLYTLFIHDMTARVRMEQAIAEENAFISAVLDTTDALVVVIDMEGRVVRWNRACERVSGFTADEMLGRDVWRLIPEEARPGVRRVMGEVVTSATALRHENEWIAKSGAHRLISWTAGAIHEAAAERVHIVATGVDITERRRAEVQAQRLQQDLYRIGRLSELGEMATAIAHELNQPLTALANYAAASRRLIERGDEEGKRKAVELLVKVVEQSQRAGQIIHRLRDLIGRGQTELVLDDINETVHEAAGLAMVGAAAGGVEAVFELEEGLPPIPFNRTQIQQVVFNLVRNAVEAIEAVEEASGGRIAIRTTARNGGKRGVEVSVSDSGPGLAAEIADNLFTPFLTTKPKGMGIGLSICRSIINAHGGEIWTKPSESGGAAFHFTLTAADEQG